MIVIDSDHTIHIPRGEAASFAISLTNETTGAAYELQDGDTLVLSVKKTHNDTYYALQKTVSGTQFDLLPSDTKKMPFGQYVYDVWLVPSTGMAQQVHTMGVFEVCREVY